MERVSGLHALNSTGPVNSLYSAQNFLLGSTLTLDCLSFHWWGAAAGQPANLTPLKTSDSISAFLGSADGNSSHLTIRCSDYRALCVYPFSSSFTSSTELCKVGLFCPSSLSHTRALQESNHIWRQLFNNQPTKNSRLGPLRWFSG